jgi:CRP-like cAMP-binding protein
MKPPVPDVHRESFLRLVRGTAPVGPDAAAALVALARERKFSKGQMLLRAGEIARDGFFLCSGLVREYYVDAAGEEYTRTFVAQGDVTGSLLDLLSLAPAVTFIQALEPTLTLALPWQELERSCDRFPELHVVLRRLAERVYVYKARREHELLTLSAARRHDDWLARHGDLDERLSRRLVASYLGITPEHLSRLRAGRR